MKKVLSLSMIFLSLLVFSQKIDLKKDTVYIDNQACLKFRSPFMGDSTDFYTLDGQKLFYIDVRDAGKNSAGYLKIGFAGSEEVLIRENDMTRKAIIKNLISEKVLVDCSLKSEMIKSFINRYEKKIDRL